MSSSSRRISAIPSRNDTVDNRVGRRHTVVAEQVRQGRAAYQKRWRAQVVRR
jgi:hypothetical protein